MTALKNETCYNEVNVVLTEAEWVRSESRIRTPCAWTPPRITISDPQKVLLYFAH